MYDNVQIIFENENFKFSSKFQIPFLFWNKKLEKNNALFSTFGELYKDVKQVY